jgi:hypothetical protein
MRMRFEEARKSTASLVLLVALFLGGLVALPYAVRGAPSNAHDIEFHLNTWLELQRGLTETHTYPQWAEGANFTLGEPRFVFYPPISLVIGALTLDVVPLRWAPGIFVFFSVALSAACMWMLAKAFVDHRWALLASALYALNPYLLLSAYTRAAYAELLLAAFAPLIILALLRTVEGSWRWTAVLAVTYGAAWMTNMPGSVLLSYSLVLMAVLLSAYVRSWKSLLRVAAGMALGLGFAASFLAPVLRERPWVQSDSVIECSTCVQHNFLFTKARTKEPVHERFNHQLSVALASEMLAGLIAIGALAMRREFRDRRAVALAVLLAVSSIMMFSPTLLLWKYLPELKFVQFPWRMGFILNCTLIVLLVIALQRISLKPRIAIAAVLVIAAAIVPWTWVPNWRALEFDKLSSNFQSGFYGVQEYAPEHLNDVQEVPRGYPPIDLGACGDTLRTEQTDTGMRYTCGTTMATVERWDARARVLHVQTLEPTTITIMQYWYPTWRVRINGKSANFEEVTDDVPFVRVNVPAGELTLEVIDETPTVKKLARVISALSLLIAVIIFAKDRRSEPVLAAVRESPRQLVNS